jgi:hypothetical protein
MATNDMFKDIPKTGSAKVGKAKAVAFADIPKKGESQNYLAGLLDSFTQGAAFGYGDELTAIEAGLLGKTPGGKWFDYSGTYDQRYQDALRAERAQNTRFRDDNPYSSMAAEIAGGISGPLAAANRGATLMRSGQSLGTAVGAGALEGAAYGALAGSGYANEGNRLGGAGEGALLGGVIGGAVPLAIGGVKRAFQGSESKATRMAADAIRQDGMTPQQVSQRLGQMTPEAMPVDLGGNLAGVGEGLASMPGRAQKVMFDALEGRAAGSNARVTGSLDDVLGPAPMPTQVDDAITRAQEALFPDYQQSLRNAKAVDTSQLAQTLDSVVASKRGPAQKAAASVRKMLNIPGSDALDPNPSTLLSTRQAIDGLLKGEVNNDVIRVLTQARKSVDAELAAKVPGLKAVDAKFENLARQREAFNEGMNIFAQGKTALRPEEFADRFATAQKQGASTMLSAGGRADLDRIVGTNINDKLALRNLIKGEGDWNLAKLRTTFGADKADEILRVIESEMTYANTVNQTLRNSRTTPRAERIRQLSGETDGTRILEDFFNFQPGTALRKVGGRVAKAFNASGLERRNEELAKLLTSKAKLESALRKSEYLSKQGEVGRVGRNLTRAAYPAGGVYEVSPLELTITRRDKRR